MAKDFIMLSSETYPIFVQQTKAALLAAQLWKHASTQVSPPKQTTPAKDVEQRELRIYDENEEQALGIILERLDAANARLVDGKTAFEAWTTLSTTHVTKTANRQYQLYQELANTRQQPNEALPAYLQQMQEAADCLSASLATGTKADDIISMLTTFLTISNLKSTEENESFKLNLSVAGKVDSATIAKSFRTEQTHRDVAAHTKEAGLAIRLGHHREEDQRQAPLPVLTDRNEEQCKCQAQQQQPKGASASKATTAEPSDEDESETVSMASSTPPLSPNSSANVDWITDSGATSSMTPHRHWI
ncbi:hypothetical protein M407DRAFT_22875 [Tulasnella calospora MUT 4182]|uniref:Uncharacterized protein n=1 Tax=Tulasnella calospora MUT 4182 TaxID=1051891 RepID=A0A0C3QKG7_9AGAM|nr:hypothetical protein M407DRAFT_22875 [Tulasnella calospora MUT 4182]